MSHVSSPKGIRELFRPGVDAVREGLRPFLLIQCCAVAAVLAFYFWPAFQGAADQLRRVKDAGGLAFSGLATACAGVVLPEIARRVTLGTKSQARHLVFQAAVFAVIGITVDLLYRLLAVLIGNEPSPSVVIRKVLIDQFVYSPSISILISTVAFLWEAEGFSLRKTREALAHGGFLQRYLPILITCWCFWIPVNAATYSLPTRVQFILFLCAQGAWSLLLVHIASGQAARSRAGAS